MADYDFEPPSFSLGLDLELQPEPQHTPPPDLLFQPAKQPPIVANLRTIEEENEDDFESPVRVSDPPRAFKRLRHGTTACLTSKDSKVRSEDRWCGVDDEIEGFSSDEDCSRGNIPTNSVCSSSKPSLHGQKVVTPQCGSQWKSRKGKEISSASASVNVETKHSGVIFPELTVSPIRRFQLIDSDSDDPYVIQDIGKEIPRVILSPKDEQSDSHKQAAMSNQGTQTTVGKYQNEDLWRGFCSDKSSYIPTPAFDEVCEEYFTNIKNKSIPKNDCEGTSNGTRLDETFLPPAHHYFFHTDSRIQKLVRDRLLYFFPLGAGKNPESRQQNLSVIDYMGQFGREENSRQTNRRCNVEKSSTRSKKSAPNSQVDSIPLDSTNWVTPRSSAGLQKNAGSRRVQAVSKSVGHWFTGPDGRRVYVNKDGQELMGQIAYRHYRKESGMGFKNSKKKTAGKKKTAAKKSSVPRK